MRPIIIKDLPRQPWKNGSGFTREIAAEPFGALAPGDFLWRVSVADVDASGPFSSFPGMDRIIIQLNGGSMLLHFVDGRSERLRPLEPFSFPGEAAVHCEISGDRSSDLNVFVRRGLAWARAEVLRLDGDTTDGLLKLTPPNAGEETFLFACQGSFSQSGASNRPLTLRAGEALRLRGDESIPAVDLQPLTAAVAIIVKIGRL